MSKQGWIAALVFVTGLSALGVGLLTADEPVIPGQQRVSPKVLKQALAERSGTSIAATAPQSVTRSVQELRLIATDIQKAGLKSEAARLNGVIREIVRRAEHDLVSKKSQIARLNAEVEELKSISEE